MLGSRRGPRLRRTMKRSRRWFDASRSGQRSPGRWPSPRRASSRPSASACRPTHVGVRQRQPPGRASPPPPIGHAGLIGALQNERNLALVDMLGLGDALELEVTDTGRGPPAAPTPPPPRCTTRSRASATRLRDDYAAALESLGRPPRRCESRRTRPAAAPGPWNREAAHEVFAGVHDMIAHAVRLARPVLARGRRPRAPPGRRPRALLVARHRRRRPSSSSACSTSAPARAASTSPSRRPRSPSCGATSSATTGVVQVQGHRRLRRRGRRPCRQPPGRRACPTSPTRPSRRRRRRPRRAAGHHAARPRRAATPPSATTSSTCSTHGPPSCAPTPTTAAGCTWAARLALVVAAVAHRLAGQPVDHPAAARPQRQGPRDGRPTACPPRCRTSSTRPSGEDLVVPEADPIVVRARDEVARRGRRLQRRAGLGHRPGRRAGRPAPQRRRVVRQPRPAQPEPAQPPARRRGRARARRARPRAPRPSCTSSTTWPPASAATPSRCWCCPTPPALGVAGSRRSHVADVVRAALGEIENYERVLVRTLDAGHGARRRLGRPRPPAGRADRERAAPLAAPRAGRGERPVARPDGYARHDRRPRPRHDARGHRAGQPAPGRQGVVHRHAGPVPRPLRHRGAGGPARHRRSACRARSSWASPPWSSCRPASSPRATVERCRRAPHGRARCRRRRRAPPRRRPGGSPTSPASPTSRGARRPDGRGVRAAVALLRARRAADRQPRGVRSRPIPTAVAPPRARARIEPARPTRRPAPAPPDPLAGHAAGRPRAADPGARPTGRAGAGRRSARPAGSSRRVRGADVPGRRGRGAAPRRCRSSGRAG